MATYVGIGRWELTGEELCTCIWRHDLNMTYLCFSIYLPLFSNDFSQLNSWVFFLFIHEIIHSYVHKFSEMNLLFPTFYLSFGVHVCILLQLLHWYANEASRAFTHEINMYKSENWSHLRYSFHIQIHFCYCDIVYVCKYRIANTSQMLSFGIFSLQRNGCIDHYFIIRISSRTCTLNLIL